MFGLSQLSSFRSTPSVRLFGVEIKSEGEGSRVRDFLTPMLTKLKGTHVVCHDSLEDTGSVFNPD